MTDNAVNLKNNKKKTYCRMDGISYLNFSKIILRCEFNISRKFIVLIKYYFVVLKYNWHDFDLAFLSSFFK